MGLMTQSTQPTKAEQALANSTDEASLRRTQARSEEIAAQIGEHPEYFRMLTGARPTGHLHLGHYFGTMQSWKQLQDAQCRHVDFGCRLPGNYRPRRRRPAA